jgi:hypothetical protein
MLHISDVWAFGPKQVTPSLYDHWECLLASEVYVVV